MSNYHAVFFLTLCTWTYLFCVVPTRADYFEVSPAHAKELEKRLFPAPLQRGSTGTRSLYFQGRILKTTAPTNPNAPVGDPHRHATLMIVAYGPGGTDKSKKPIFVNASLLQLVIDELDSFEDLERLFSSFRTPAGHSLVDPRGRYRFQALLDPMSVSGLPRVKPSEEYRRPGAKEDYVPDGFDSVSVSGLPHGGLEPSGEYRRPGAIEGYVSDGFQVFLQRTAIERTAGMPDARAQMNLGSEEQHLEKMVMDLLVATARSELFFGFEKGFHKFSRDAVITLCELAVAAPESAPAAQRASVERIARLGRIAIKTLGRSLILPPGALLEATGFEAFNLYNRNMQITLADIAKVSAEIIAEGPALAFIDDDYATSASLFQRLFMLAETEEYQALGLQPVAKAALLNLVEDRSHRWRSPNEEVSFRSDVDIERYRQLLHPLVCQGPEASSSLALELLNQVGWAPYKSGKERALTCLRVAVQAMSNLPEGDPVPAVAAANVATLKSFLRARPNPSDNSEIESQAQISSKLSEKIQEIRTSAASGYSYDQYRTFLDYWDRTP